MTPELGRANVRRVWGLSDATDRREGSRAYLGYKITLARFAGHYGASVEGTVAAFCALSPNNDFKGNLRSLATLLWGRREGVPVNRLVVSTYGACKLRAWAYLEGRDFLEHTQGPKTRAFFQNILHPLDPHPVTIDGHMVGVWYGQRMTMKEAVYTRFRYEELAQGFRQVAADLGLCTNQLQATLWFTWKRLHQVVYSPQLDLVRTDDQWGQDLRPEDVRPWAPRSNQAAPQEAFDFNPRLAL
jgi:hypothetical protein